MTGPIWYSIIRKQNVIVGATYELKYVIVLALIYSFLGDRALSWNTYLGISLAIASVYFISK